MAEILIAEDERNVREGLEDLFVGAGYGVRTAKDGEDALTAYTRRRPDLLLLDLMMPRRDGFEVLSEIRRRDPLLPVLLLTACGEQVDKVKGLGWGADDYITKAFYVTELLARVARALQRAAAVEAARVASAAGSPAETSAAQSDVPSASFAFAHGLVDPSRMVLTGITRAPIPLTAREVGILRLFAHHPDEVLGREHLLGTLWGIGYCGNTRTLDQHIAQLRRKLGRQAGCIETVIGVGYRYVPIRNAGGRR